MKKHKGKTMAAGKSIRGAHRQPFDSLYGDHKGGPSSKGSGRKESSRKSSDREKRLSKEKM